MRLDWDYLCTSTSPVDRAIPPGSTARLYVTVLGQAAGHQAYQLRMAVIPGGGGAFPDAWRFDPQGCQGPSFISFDYHVAAAIKTCPNLPGALAALQIKDYSFDPISGRARIVFANAYPPGQLTANPLARYFLLSVLFDHTFSTSGPTVPGVTCGGLETPMCFVLTTAEWLTLDGVETPWAVERGYLTANDPQNVTACPGATPARPTTWGALRAHYRN